MTSKTHISASLTAVTGSKKKSLVIPAVILLGATFLMIFGPKLFSITSAFDTITLTSIGLTLYYWGFIARHTPPLRSGWQHPVLFFVVLIVYSLVVALLVSPLYQEFYYPARFLRVIINYLGCLSLCGLYAAHFGLEFRSHVLFYIFVAITIHAIIMELQFANDGFRYWVYSWSGYEADSLALTSSGKRVSGLTLSYSSLSLVQGFGTMIAPVVWRDWPERIPRLLFIPMLIAVVPATLLAGRTGFFTTAMCATVIFIFVFLRHPSRRWSQILILVTIPLGLAIFVFLLSDDKTELFGLTLNRLMEVFVIDESGARLTLAGSWQTVLDHMYFLPEDPWVTIFGSSISGRGNIYVASDVGYILYIFGVGVFGLSLVIGFYVYALIIARKMWQIDSVWALVSIMFVVLVAFQNGKELIMLTRHGFTVTCILLCAYYFSQMPQSIGQAKQRPQLRRRPS